MRISRRHSWLFLSGELRTKVRSEYQGNCKLIKLSSKAEAKYLLPPLLDGGLLGSECV